MAFRPPHAVTARWRPCEGVGLEHLDLRPAGDMISVRSIVVGERGGRPFGVTYGLSLRADWTVMRLDLVATDGRGLSLRSDGGGRWTDGDGEAIPVLDGCIDIDLAGSPFTNTLPIRRDVRLRTGNAIRCRMAYVPFDTFAPLVDDQIYTALDAGRRYRYEAADGTFTAEIAVDEDGLVTDYPGLFTRVLL